MLTLIIVLVAVAVVLASTATFVVTGRRRRPTIEAPPSGPTAAPAARPTTAAPADIAPRAPPITPLPIAGDDRAPAGADLLVPERGPGSGLLDAGEPDLLQPEAVETAPQGSDGPGPDDVPDAAPGAAGDVGVLERPRFRDRLGKARNLFSGYLTSVRARERIDASTWDELEEALILADVGVEVATGILDDLRARVKKDVTTPAQLIDALKADMVGLLAGDRELHLAEGVTNVWLFVGVNGVGKTTTIGKLGLRARSEGRAVVMAAGDTFRAAAADQLTLWAERVDAEVVRGAAGGDPGAVIFDAVQHAAARKTDLVLADTAGRLHTKVNLMEELKKVRRVADRPPGRVTEVLLVIDATTGQNGLIQAKQFADAVDVTGVVLTKLDGTAKGGIALAITAELGLPIKLVGLGEGAADLIEFDPEDFVDALVGTD